MGTLLFGAEVEFGVSASGSSEHGFETGELTERLLREARRQHPHLADINSDNGIFLRNGSRFYQDGTHPEMASPECTNPWDAVRYVEAGNEILLRLAAPLRGRSRRRREILLLRSNVDLSGSYTGAESPCTFGFHESFLYRNSHDVLKAQLLSHLATRAIYTGAGGFDPFSPGLRFVLSPRATFVRELSSECSTGEYRSLWHTKNEPLSASTRRLHILSGESVCSHRENWLRFGVTSLLVALADAGLQPGRDVQLADPLKALHAVIADPQCKERLALHGGGSATSIEIQRSYLAAVNANLLHECMPPWAGEVCAVWRDTLDKLETDPALLGRTLDWAIKNVLYARFARERGIDWETLPRFNRVIEAAAARPGLSSSLLLKHALESDQPPKAHSGLEPLLNAHGFNWDDVCRVLRAREILFEIETRFSQLGEKGIFAALDRASVLDHGVRGVDNIEHAIENPPATGRAQIRGREIRLCAGKPNMRCDWQFIADLANGTMLDLSDPFVEAAEWKPISPDSSMWPELANRIHDRFTPSRFVPDRESPDVRREMAYRCYISGDYAEAEELLRGCVEEGFEVASNRCHIARVLMMMDHEAEARQEIERAWQERSDGTYYAIARILFFQLVFAMIDGQDNTDMVRAMRTELDATQARMSWTIQPMLDHLEERLTEQDFAFLRALAGALSDTDGMPALEQFAAWRAATAVGVLGTRAPDIL